MTRNTSGVQGLHAVVVDLQSGVGARPGESDHVILVVAHFNPHFTDWVVVGAHVVHHKHVALHLCCFEINLCEGGEIN